MTLVPTFPVAPVTTTVSGCVSLICFEYPGLPVATPPGGKSQFLGLDGRVRDVAGPATGVTVGTAAAMRS